MTIGPDGLAPFPRPSPMGESEAGWLTALIIAMILGPVCRWLLGTYGLALIENETLGVYTIAHLSTLTWILVNAPTSIISMLWVSSVCRRRRRKAMLWRIFALLFGVVGVAIFFGYLAYEDAEAAKSEDRS